MNTADIERLAELEQMLDEEEELDEEELDELRDLRSVKRDEKRKAKSLKQWQAAKFVWRCPAGPFGMDDTDGFVYALKKDDFFSELATDPSTPYYEYDMRIRAEIEPQIEYTDRPQALDGLSFEDGRNPLFWYKEVNP